MQKLLQTPWDVSDYPVILIVEDSEEDFEAFMRATRNLNGFDNLPYPFLNIQSGDQTLDYLFRRGEFDCLIAPLPALILLDLNLPGTDGRDIIKELKQAPKLQTIPIVILTSSNNPRDIEACYRYGVSSYMVKPMGGKELRQKIQALFDYWFRFNVLPCNVLPCPVMSISPY